jgi:hypothetical protein
MRRFHILMLAVSLTLIAPVGHALADGPGAGYSGVKIAQVGFIDRGLNVIQLSDGMELKAPDARMLAGLTVGEWVKVDFSSDGARNVVNSVRPARPDEVSVLSPAISGDVANRS